MNKTIKKVHVISGDNMKVKDIMSRNLIIAESDDNVLYVSNLMRKYDVGFVLILKNDKLLGVITDRDLVCTLPKENDKIESYITNNIITIDKNEDVENALNKMKYNKVKRIVVTFDNKVVGVISLSDIYNTDIDSNTILSALKEIYTINRNSNYFEIDVHEFPL